MRLLTTTALAALALAACSEQAPAPQDAAQAPEPAVETIIPAGPKDSAAAPAAEEEAPSENAAFLAIADDHAKRVFAAAPEWATSLGVDEAFVGGKFNDKLGLYGLASRERALELNEAFLGDIATVDRDKLTGQAAATYDILRASYEIAVRRNDMAYGPRAVLGGALPYPVTQLSGLQFSLPRLLQTQQPLGSAAEAEDYLARLAAMEGALDATTESAIADAEAGVTPPKFALEKIVGGLRSFIAPAPAEHSLVTTLETKLAEVDGVDAAAFAARAADIVQKSVYPAYDRMAAAYEGMIETASDDAGVWRLPKGGQLYQVALDSYGAAGMTAEEVHAIGLAEVERVTAEMDAILTAEGYTEGTVGERMNALTVDERFLYPNTDEGKAQIIEDLNGLVAAFEPKLPDWFRALPPQPVEVRRIPDYEEASAPGGYYTGPPLDGSRPGIFWINLRDTAEWPKFDLPTLTYHEAAPGHHFQIALQRNQKDLPIIRNMMGFSEFAEGWALYAELLAKEMGLYDDDPYGDLGRLRAELFRSVRLVVDTGIHQKQWTRDEAIDYMVEKMGNQRSEATTEIERYAVLPGQATSYKLGMLKMEELRAKAEAELGEAFDIRDFHDVVLLGGMRPLPVLEEDVTRWIAETQAG